MDLSIIIVSYNTKDLLIDCLQSIYKYPVKLTFEVIVVDNHSTDETVPMLEAHFPQVRLVKNQSNLGFGKANNQAAQKALGAYLWFLNSDTTLHKDTLKRLFTLTQQSDADVSSCQLRYSNGAIQPQGGSLPHLINIFFWMTGIDDLSLISKLIPRYQQSNPLYDLE